MKKKISYLLVFCMLLSILISDGGKRETVYAADGVNIPTWIDYTGLPDTVKVGETGTMQFEWPVIGGIQSSGTVKIGIYFWIPLDNEEFPEERLIVNDDYTWQAVSPGTVELVEEITFSEETLNALTEKYGHGYQYDTARIQKITITESDDQPVYRLYNPNSGEHFYTESIAEWDSLVKVGWKNEGTAWIAPGDDSSDTPVYRLYNPNEGEHFYTMSEAERDLLIKQGWKDEGIAFYSAEEKTTPIYRGYNVNERANNHNYTVNTNEQENLISLGWRDEGIAWYGK